MGSLVATRRAPARIPGIPRLPFLYYYEARLIKHLAGGASVPTWFDYSKNGYHAVTSGSLNTTNPTFSQTTTFNGKPTIAATGSGGSGQGLDMPTTARHTTAGSLYIVFRVTADPASVSSAGALLNMGGDAGAAKNSHHPFSDSNIYDAYGTNARITVGNPAASMSSTHRCYRIRAAGGTVRHYLDGTLLKTTTSVTHAWNAWGPYLFHSNNTANNWWRGNVALIAGLPDVRDDWDKAMQLYITRMYRISF